MPVRIMPVRIKPESDGSHLAATIGKDLPPGLDFSTRDPDFDVMLTIKGGKYRFPKILKDLSGYQREWLNDSTIKLLRATAIALIDDKVPERFARHIRQDIEDADFRRTPGDTVMAARIKKSARQRERANYVDVEGIRCFCMGHVPEFALDNLKLAQSSEWMAYSPEVISLSDCRPVHHTKSVAAPGRLPRKPFDEVLRVVDREDWVWFGRPDLDARLVDPRGQSGSVQPAPIAQMELDSAPMVEMPVQEAEVALGRKTWIDRATHTISDMAMRVSGKLRAVVGQVHLPQLSPALVWQRARRALSAQPQIAFAFVALVAVIFFALEPRAFKEAFPASTSSFSRLSSGVQGVLPGRGRSASGWAASVIVRILCLALSSLTAAIAWLQQTRIGQAIPAEQRIVFHHIHNLTRAMEQC